MAAHRHRILIVEDDDDLREATSALLEGAGYGISLAADGAEALAVLRSGTKPAAILLDLMMPVMSGWAFREHQLADPRLADIPVVVLTATVGAIRTRLPGVAAVLSKPLDIEVLLDRLGGVCNPP